MESKNEIYVEYFRGFEQARQKRFALSVKFVILIFQISGGALVLSIFPKSHLLVVIGLAISAFAAVCWWILSMAARENFRMKMLVARELEKQLTIAPVETESRVLKDHKINHKYDLVENYVPIAFALINAIVAGVLTFLWFPFTLPL